jgi:flavodoxin short chain
LLLLNYFYQEERNMNEIMVVYWSQTGNTEAMAQAVAEGIREAGKTAVVTEVSGVSADALKNASAFALGCPAMGAEVLEESEMEPFVVEIEAIASGKKIGLFGSYGWGDGQWMRDWVERMTNAGADVPGGEGVIAQEAPDEDALAQCRALGRTLAE